MAAPSDERRSSVDVTRMYLARKVTRAKWREEISVGRVPADAVTADLRTQSNMLSFWRCGSANDNEIDNAVLALAAGSDRIDKLELVWVSEADLREDGLSLSETKGRTPVPDLAEHHVDAQHLDYDQLGKVAGRVLAAIAEGCYRRVRKANVKELLAAAIEAKRVERSALPSKLASEFDG